VRQLEAFHAGYLGAAARTWDTQERRNIYLGNVASKRKKSVARLPWEIKQTEDSREAKRQAEVLTAFYNSIRVTSVLEQNERGGLSLLIRQMMDAVGKKFAVHEIVWSPTPQGLNAEFRFCPLWWFENITGKLRYLPQDFMIDGEEMLEGEWLVTVGEGNHGELLGGGSAEKLATERLGGVQRKVWHARITGENTRDFGFRRMEGDGGCRPEFHE
jgi:phage gp29-like protein